MLGAMAFCDDTLELSGQRSLSNPVRVQTALEELDLSIVERGLGDIHAEVKLRMKRRSRDSSCQGSVSTVPIMRAGLPTTTCLGGTSWSTTVPIPTTDHAPILVFPITE